MITKIQKIFTVITAASWFMSGCALTTSTTTSPETTTLTFSTSPAGTIAGATTAQTTTAQTTTAGTTSPVTVPTTTAVSTTAANTQTPATTVTETSATTTTAATTSPDTTPAKPTNPIDPADIKTGNAYDTATVRDWMWNTEAADYYPSQKLVFLTFDDGPSTNVTPKILDILEKNDVNATFFYYPNGSLEGRAEIVKRTVENGNVIAIHTSSHNYSKLYPKRIADVDAIVEDAQKAISSIRAILGEDWTTGVYRFPGGSFSWTGTKTAKAQMRNAKNALSGIGLEYLDWNAMSGDSDQDNKDKSPEGLVKYTIQTTKEAAGHVIVVLMHDAGHVTNGPKALQGIIDYYKGAGYEFGVLK